MLTPINKSSGTTKTEKYLAKLCKNTFLSLWSYPNPYTDSNRKNNKGDGQELCDLLIVFENNILIFSDKYTEYKSTNNSKVDYNRWFNKTILSSAHQAYKAEKWIKRYPNRVFVDRQCKQRFPFNLSKMTNPNFFRFVVTQNTKQIAMQYFGGLNSGSLVINTEIQNETHFENPFVIGNIDSNNGFIHVLDEVTLDVLLQELDTVNDFINYIKAKENLFDTVHCIIPGEEDLLAHYIVEGHTFTKKIQTIKEEHSKLFIVEEGSWIALQQTNGYRQFHKDIKISYKWDELIELFNESILTARTGKFVDQPFSKHELAVRFLASENRTTRACLAQAYIEKLNSTPPKVRTSRIVLLPDSKRCYIFVIFPHDSYNSLDDYRNERIALLQIYAQICKIKRPEANYFIVIGTEPNGTVIRSEDLIAIEILEPPLPKVKKELMKISRESRILDDIEIPKHITNFSEYTGATTKKISRNSKCSCGSGIKYKHCCL